jgi:hypothetical protein
MPEKFSSRNFLNALNGLRLEFFSAAVRTADPPSSKRGRATVAAKSNANALFSLQRHEQERSQPAQLSV